jgi:hypothetical protein
MANPKTSSLTGIETLDVMDYANSAVNELLHRFALRPIESAARSNAFLESLRMDTNKPAERERAIGCLVDLNLFLATVKTCCLYEFPSRLGECNILNNSLRGDFILWLLGAKCGDHLFIATKSGDNGMVRKMAQCCRAKDCVHDAVEYYSSFLSLVA